MLGAHSAIGVALDAMGLPTDALAYELQAATFFRRAQPLEEMARQREFLRLATDDQRLIDSPDRVPVANGSPNPGSPPRTSGRWVRVPRRRTRSMIP